jgi:hypothetical protein
LIQPDGMKLTEFGEKSYVVKPI